MCSRNPLVTLCVCQSLSLRREFCDRSRNPLSTLYGSDCSRCGAVRILSWLIEILVKDLMSSLEGSMTILQGFHGAVLRSWRCWWNLLRSPCMILYRSVWEDLVKILLLKEVLAWSCTHPYLLSKRSLHEDLADAMYERCLYESSCGRLFAGSCIKTL